METTKIMRVVAIKESNSKMLKVYAEDGMAVSVPVAYRATLSEGVVSTLEVALAVGGRFYKAVGLNKPKGSSSKKTLSTATKAKLDAIFGKADAGAEAPKEDAPKEKATKKETK